MALPQKYTRTAVILHWVIAVLILLNIVGGLTPQLWPKPMEQQVIGVHKSVGMTIFGLVLLRILWRATHPPPPLPGGYKPWERTLSHLTHGVLYLMILAIPITGYLHDSAWKEAPTHPNSWFGLIPWPRAPFLENLEPAAKEYWHDTLFTWHMWLAFALLGLLVLHVAGALKHQFVDGEQELQRMTT